MTWSRDSLRAVPVTIHAFENVSVRDRLERAVWQFHHAAREAEYAAERARLYDKASGVLLALSYLDEARRTGGDQ